MQTAHTTVTVLRRATNAKEIAAVIKGRCCRFSRNNEIRFLSGRVVAVSGARHCHNEHQHNQLQWRTNEITIKS